MTITEQARDVAMRQPIMWQTQFADGSGKVYLNEQPLRIQAAPIEMQPFHVLEIHYGNAETAFYLICKEPQFGINQQAILTLTRLTPAQKAILDSRQVPIHTFESASALPAQPQLR